MKGVYTVVSGAVAEERRLSFISNNLANALTAGYKASKPAFEGVLSSSVIDVGMDKKDNTFVGTYDSHINFADGSFVETRNPFDLAIQGDGFFVIDTPQGDRYTRNGQFTLNADKKLTTHDGYLVMGEGGAVTIDNELAGPVTIDKDGAVYVGRQSVGKIRMVRFATKEDLRPVGNSLFENTNPENRALPATNGEVNQGYYEASNVDVVKEMLDMITCIRAYEAYTKVQQAFGDMSTKLEEVARV